DAIFSAFVFFGATASAPHSVSNSLDLIAIDPTSHQDLSSLLPRCYQDRTNQPHLAPCREGPVLWFLVGLGGLRLDQG
ncbi:hypothetical protein, partial [Petrachloros mirabilis]